MKLNVPEDYLMDLYELIWDHVKEDWSIPKDKRRAYLAMMGDLYGARLEQMTHEDFMAELDKVINGDIS